MQLFNHLRQILAVALVLLLAAPDLGARTRKGDRLFKEGQAQEAKKDLEKALEFYERAAAEDPEDAQYMMALRRVRFLAGQARVDQGQKLRDQGKLEEALAEFQKAFAIDPSSMIAEQELRRTFQMIEREKQRAAPASPQERALTPEQAVRKEVEERIATYQNIPELKPVVRQITSLKMNNQPPRVLYETLAKLAGLNVVFDPDYLQQAGGRNFSLDISNSTVEDALDYLAVLTKSSG